MIYYYKKKQQQHRNNVIDTSDGPASLTGQSVHQSPTAVRQKNKNKRKALKHNLKTKRQRARVFTYLPLRDSLPRASAIISKAPKSAFYGDPCLCVQYRGALVISLQACAQRNAPRRDGRTHGRDGEGGGKDAHAVCTDRTPSRRSVRDAASHEVYFTSRGRVPRARLTSDERNGVAREV